MYVDPVTCRLQKLHNITSYLHPRKTNQTKDLRHSIMENISQKSRTVHAHCRYPTITKGDRSEVSPLTGHVWVSSLPGPEGKCIEQYIHDLFHCPDNRFMLQVYWDSGKRQNLTVLFLQALWIKSQSIIIKKKKWARTLEYQLEAWMKKNKLNCLIHCPRNKVNWGGTTSNMWTGWVMPFCAHIPVPSSTFQLASSITQQLLPFVQLLPVGPSTMSKQWNFNTSHWSC